MDVDVITPVQPDWVLIHELSGEAHIRRPGCLPECNEIVGRCESGPGAPGRRMSASHAEIEAAKRMADGELPTVGGPWRPPSHGPRVARAPVTRRYDVGSPPRDERAKNSAADRNLAATTERVRTLGFPDIVPHDVSAALHVVPSPPFKT